MNDQDELIQNLMKKAALKEKEIGEIQNYANQTNLSFPLLEGSVKDSKNLNVINDVRELVSLMSILVSKKDAHDVACRELGVKYIFTWGGFSFGAWKLDILNRVGVIELRKKKTELKEIKDVLDELLSPEAKKMKKLEEIAKRLDNN